MSKAKELVEKYKVDEKDDKLKKELENFKTAGDNLIKKIPNAHPVWLKDINKEFKNLYNKINSAL